MYYENDRLNHQIISTALRAQALIANLLNKKETDIPDKELSELAKKIKSSNYFHENTKEISLESAKSFVEKGDELLNWVKRINFADNLTHMEAEQARSELWILDGLIPGTKRNQQNQSRDIEELKDAIKLFHGEIDLLRDNSKRNIDSLDERNTLALNRVEHLETLLERLEEQANNISNEAEIILENVRIDSESKKAQLEKIIGVLAETAVRGHYQRNADAEKKSADNFRRGSSLVMLIAVIFLAKISYSSALATFSPAEILTRIATTLLLLIPSAYFARESSRHRALQNQYEQKAMILATIDPYISSLTPNEQNKVKCNLVNTLFTPPHQADNKNTFPLNTQEIVMSLIDKIDVPDSKKTKD